MQGKGIVKFFLVVLTLVTLAQYLYVLPTQKVEKAAAAYAQKACPGEGENSLCYKEKRTAFLDSMSSEEVLKIPLLKSWTYQELKGNQLALGLDLKGGMSVVLQVDLREFIQALANDSKDPTFLDALNRASQLQSNQQSDYVTRFADAYRDLSKGKKLAPLFARTPSLRDQINFETADGEVVRLIRERANETVDLTFKLLKERIDKLGVTQPNVSLDAARDLILVELPGIDNPERARGFLQAAAKLEFWNVYRISDPGVQQSLIDANRKLSEIMGTMDTQSEIAQIDTTFATDSLGNQDKTKIVKIDTIYSTPNLNKGPLFDLLTMNTVLPTGQIQFSPAVIGMARKNQKDRIDSLLNNSEVKPIFPPDLVFRWSKDPYVDFQTNEETDEYQLYAIRLERGTDKPLLTGESVTNARPETDPTTGNVTVSLSMDNAGAKTWAQMTTKAAQDNNREIAIMLDDEVVSAPGVDEPITGGNSSIRGTYTIQEAQDFANILQIGKLPAELRIVSDNVIGPSLGKENISRSLTAIILAFVAVMIFMIIYYAGGGVVSVVALFANLFFIFGSLASAGTVLTLPGIAGIVLTMGMAVDANVIIFERIREELRAGKSLLAAISDGFKHSYSAIIDANVTTILTCLVLAYFGLGPIKGFGVVLIIGILASMFTAVLVSRLIIDWWTINRGKNMRFSNKFSENIMSNVNVNWMRYRGVGYAISGALLIISIISFFTRGFDLGVDFKGGYSFNVQFEQGIPVDAQKIRTALTPVFGTTPVVKVVDAENTFNITTAYLIADTSGNAQEKVMDKLYEGINTIVGGKLDYDQFKKTDSNGTHISSSSRVGPTIADDIRSSSFKSGLFALLLIFGYLAIRFSQWQFSLGAVIALLHDAVITMGMFSLLWGFMPFSMEIDQAFVAAILTVIGYSVNDTVIVFDRIREFSNIYAGRPKEEVFNLAINNTLSRTINTSGTTLIVVVMLLIFGGGVIKGFAFALFIGILFGTYSSVFVASALVVDLIKGIKGKTEVTKKTFSKAASKAKV
ncbi:MAG: protein translocase subunit SecDF [Saprospiraceae bacterium]|nr:protein translocase subunit SecDF [Saprospiraceae bacterium]